MSRKLARTSFHGMVRFGAGAQRRQAFLFRLVDVAMELFAISATACRARALADQRPPRPARRPRSRTSSAGGPARRPAKLQELASNDDAAKTRLARGVLDGRAAWVEDGILGTDWTPETLRPRSVEELLAEEQAPQPTPLASHALSQHPPRRSGSPTQARLSAVPREG
jgi:hypothetical protein